jgi:hypothetical protein
MAIDAIKYTFSGHESFQCRQLWLKKGYDFIQDNQSFNDEDAVVKLGVGKNMVSAIRFWMEDYNITNDKNNPIGFGLKLFNNKSGFDSFLKDEASLWLLNYQLIKTGLASIYSIVFNVFRKEKLFFNKGNYVNYLKRRREAKKDLYFRNTTVDDGFDVFVKMYQRFETSKDVEESLSRNPSEVVLLKTIGKAKEEQCQIDNNERDILPKAILLFSILGNPNFSNSISLSSLKCDINRPSSMFCLTCSGPKNKFLKMVHNNLQSTFSIPNVA